MTDWLMESAMLFRNWLLAAAGAILTEEIVPTLTAACLRQPRQGFSGPD
jgi:hypothetical protein